MMTAPSWPGLPGKGPGDWPAAPAPPPPAPGVGVAPGIPTLAFPPPPPNIDGPPGPDIGPIPCSRPQKPAWPELFHRFPPTPTPPGSP
jgi:hypothetical protein